MMMTQEEMIDTVFIRAEDSAGDPFVKSNLHVFNVLMAIDGQRSVTQIAREDLYQVEELVDAINEMLARGLIAPTATNALDAARPAFFKKLEAQLGQIMGPVGNFLIQEKATEAGHPVASYPMANAQKLIDLLAQTITDEGAARKFKRSMTEELNKLG